MFNTLGLVVASSMLQVPAEPASIRVNLVAYVPVTCSTGSVLRSDTTPNGLRAALVGSCNADHVVRITLLDGSNARSAQLNGNAGVREQQSFRFLRPAYFASVSTLEVDFGETTPSATLPASQILVEISPV